VVTLNGLHPELMRPRVEAFLADPEVRKRGVYVISAFRTLEHQKRLFDAAVKRYGSLKAAKRWVAAPGRSNHGPKVDGYGIAVDFGVPGVRAVSGQWPEELNRWFQAKAAEYGLFQRMPWEDWHYEPIANWQPKKEHPFMALTDAEQKELVENSRQAVTYAKAAASDAKEARDLASKAHHQVAHENGPLKGVLRIVRRIEEAVKK
jgi:hypothetical protein